MEKWNIRKPHGLVEEPYPFNDNYKKLNGSATYVFAISQDEGMLPDIVSEGLQWLLDLLAAHIPEKLTVDLHIANNNSKPKTFDALSADLIKNAESKESPWYWDDVYTTIEAEELKLLVQPESDGMDICVYLTGPLSERVYQSLITHFNNRKSS